MDGEGDVVQDEGVYIVIPYIVSYNDNNKFNTTNITLTTSALQRWFSRRFADYF